MHKVFILVWKRKHNRANKPNEHSNEKTSTKKATRTIKPKSSFAKLQHSRTIENERPVQIEKDKSNADGTQNWNNQKRKKMKQKRAKPIQKKRNKKVNNANNDIVYRSYSSSSFILIVLIHKGAIGH